MIDNTLIEECHRGNLSRFRELVKMTSPFVYSIAFRMLGDEETARDVVQDTMINVWQKIGKIKSPGAYKMWVYRIVMNKCYDMLRQKKNSIEMSGDEKVWQFLSENITDKNDVQLENNEISAIIGVLTARLSPKQKSVFILSEIDDLSNEEISSITGLSKTSVKANLCYARKNISEMLKKYLR